MRPKFPEEVAYLGGLLRRARLEETEDFYRIEIEAEEEFIDEVERLLEDKLTGKYRREGNQIVIDGPDMVHLLIDLFGSPDGEGRWELTPEIKKGYVHHKRHFLRGLFDGMGEVDDGIKLDYHWHEEDLGDIREMMDELGIDAEIEDGNLHVRDETSFASEIGSLRPRNRHKLASLLSSAR